MCNYLPYPVAVILVVCVCHPRPAPAADTTFSEPQKIESLLTTVEGLKDARFIRNGKEYHCKAAAQHVRRKWKAARDQIKTARQFVTAVASRSEKTGQAYRIRFKDGSEQTSEAFLTTALDKIEGKDPGEKGGSS